MFEHLDGFKVVLVTGPQRSGTTIVARMIAADTDLAYVDEQAFQATDVAKWRGLIETGDNFVIQCPGMCRWVHDYGLRDDVAVVMVRRDIDDIIASQKRIGWRYEQAEIANYADIPAQYASWLNGHEMTIAEIKYRFWEEHQRGLIQNAYTVDYESLASHPLWVPKERRRFFAPRQWRE
jgi:hypothetical protein